MLDSFVVLDRTLENTLNSLMDETFHGTIANFVISFNEYNEGHIKELKKHGYLELKDCSAFNGHSAQVTLTYNGINYLKHKEQYLKKKRKKQNVEWTRYIITTLISIAALVLSIISLVKN